MPFENPGFDRAQYDWDNKMPDELDDPEPPPPKECSHREGSGRVYVGMDEQTEECAECNGEGVIYRR